MVNQVFNVLTEFRFDIAHAVAGSKTLQGELDKISGAADQAHNSLKNMGMNFLSQAVGIGGVVGAIMAAVNASDKFESSQRAIANILMTNNLFTGPDAFKNSMIEAATAMENINKVANKFSLPSEELLSFSKLIGATLINSGLDNSRLEKSIDLSRGFLKSAPVLGIHPRLAQGQLMDAIGTHQRGGANMGDTLFRRLTGETNAMKPYAGSTGTKTFNMLPQAQRLDLLTKALSQFGSVTEIVTANANSLHSQMERLRNNIVGTFSVLRAIGKVLMDPLKDALLKINVYLETNGKKLVQQVADIFGEMFKDPEKLFVNIQQMRRLKDDVRKAGDMLFFAAIIHGITHSLHFFGITLRGGLIMSGLRMLMRGIGWIGGFIFSSKGLLLIWRTLSFVLRSVVWPLMLFTTIMQGISRGLAQAKVTDAKWIIKNMEKFMAFFATMKTHLVAIMAPFELAIKGIANFVEWIFTFGGISQFVVDNLWVISTAFEFLGKTIVGILSVISGAMNMIIGMGFDKANGTGFIQTMRNMGSNFMAGMNDMWDTYYKPKVGLDVTNQNTAQTKIEIDKIEINNAFKENAEPDRIAFTMKEQLLKAALNPTQSVGRSLTGATIGN